MANDGGLKAVVINIGNNQPIGEATAKLSGPVDKSTQTASNGSFEFSELPAANDYQLIISAPGFTTERYHDIVVIENNVTDLQKLALWPEED